MRGSRRGAWAGFVAATALASTAVLGADDPAKPSGAGQPSPQEFVTEHTATIAGRKLAYTAIAGETVLNDTKGAPGALVFTFSYIARGNDTGRPVAFIFNGGPGSSSIWTHLGMLGPRQVKLPDPIKPPTAAPFAVVDSPLSLLAVADLVFIDPVGTGFSRLIPGGRSEDFLGVTQDARATADLMQAWLTRHGRWNSPKFILGESYGTARAIMTTLALMGGVTDSAGQLRGISLNGILILGPAFEIGPTVEGDDRAYLSNLPAMAATAQYHGRLADKSMSLQQAVEAARTLAAGDYLRALYAGNRLPAADRDRVARQLEALTGIPQADWSAADLRVTLAAFAKEVLKDQKLSVGAYDSRYTLPLTNDTVDPVADDPAMGQYTPAFSGAFNDYVQNELKVRTTTPYVAIDWKNVFFRWDRGAGPGVVLLKNYASELAIAMRRNPALKVFVAAGYFDLVTTYGGADYALSHADIPAERATLRGYPSGHMPYLGGEAAQALSTDLKDFIVTSSRPTN